MSEELKKIIEQLNAIAEKLKDDSISAEEIDKLEGEAAALETERGKITAAMEKRSKTLDSIAKGGAEYGSITKRFKPPAANKVPRDNNENSGDNSLEYRNAFKDYVLRGTPIPMELRADANTKTTDAGVVIPTVVLNRIIENLESVGMILPLVTRTAYKGGVSIPVEGVKPVATWVAEGAGSDKQKKATTTISFLYNKLRCAVSISLEVEIMALPMFEALIIKNITEAMTKAIEQAIISGDGSGKPAGIVSAATLALVPAAQKITVTDGVTYDILIKAESALPLAYESKAVWCMNKPTFMSFIGITDDNGQPIARVNYGLDKEMSRILLGRKVVLCDYMPSFGDGVNFAFLFDFSDYILNTNLDVRITKYEEYSTDDKVTKAVMLIDGKPVSVKSLVVLTGAE